MYGWMYEWMYGWMYVLCQSSKANPVNFSVKLIFPCSKSLCCHADSCCLSAHAAPAPTNEQPTRTAAAQTPLPLPKEGALAAEAAPAKETASAAQAAPSRQEDCRAAAAPLLRTHDGRAQRPFSSEAERA